MTTAAGKMTKTSAAPPDFNLRIQSSEIILQTSVPHYTAAGGLFHLVSFCSQGVPLISNLALSFCPCPWKAEGCEVSVMLLMALLCQAPLRLRMLKGIAGGFTFTSVNQHQTTQGKCCRFRLPVVQDERCLLQTLFLLQTFLSK